MGTCTWKYAKACMGYRKQVSSCKDSYKNDRMKKVTGRAASAPFFWKHDLRPICFGLCVDDFGVKYVEKQHTEHLMNSLK